MAVDQAGENATTAREQYVAVLKNRLPLAMASECVRSWFELHLYRVATRIIAIPLLPMRQQQLDLCPDSYKKELKKEIARLWSLRK
jgi:hypothetical protein